MKNLIAALWMVGAGVVIAGCEDKAMPSKPSTPAAKPSRIRTGCGDAAHGRDGQHQCDGFLDSRSARLEVGASGNAMRLAEIRSARTRPEMRRRCVRSCCPPRVGMCRRTSHAGRGR